jgi:hypothetical protein
MQKRNIIHENGHTRVKRIRTTNEITNGPGILVPTVEKSTPPLATPKSIMAAIKSLCHQSKK